MKNQIINSLKLTAILAVAFGLAACSGESSEPSAPAAPSTPSAPDSSSAPAAPAAPSAAAATAGAAAATAQLPSASVLTQARDQAANLSHADKAKFIQTVSSAHSLFSGQVGSVIQSTTGIPADAVRDFHAAGKALQDQLSLLEGVSAEGWDDAKKGVLDALTKVTTAYGHLQSAM